MVIVLILKCTHPRLQVVVEARAAREARMQQQQESTMARAETNLMGLAEAETRMWAQMEMEAKAVDALARRAALQRDRLTKEHNEATEKVREFLKPAPSP